MLSLSAVTASAQVTLKAGTYEAVEQGIGGPFKVTVQINNNKLVSIQVGQNKETPGIGEMAIKKLPQQIIDAQSTQINSIAGASVTSAAILKAVNNCIKQAGGNPDNMKVKKSDVAVKHETLNTDLVVVGGGAAGMLAAINAKQHGVNVILLEKMNFLGGASAICGGGVVSQGSQAQKVSGVTNDSPALMAYDMLVNGNKENDLTTLTFYANNVGKSVDWLRSLGIKFEPQIEYRGEYSANRLFELEGGCPRFAQSLRELVAKEGIKVLVGTKAEEILTKNSVPYGVRAKSTDGVEYTINAKAILMATGGFGANKDMLAGNLKKTLYYGPVSSTGDGHKMLEHLGAQMESMDKGKVYPNGVQAAPGIALSTAKGNRAALETAGIFVDRNGKRFINEKAAGKDIKAHLFKQPDLMLFVVMDAPSFKAFRTASKGNGLTDDLVEGWLKNNGKSVPIFAHGQTIEEAAKNAGVNAANLKATIEKYNQYVRNGKDEEFGRPKAFMRKEFDATGPYYIVEQRPRFATTLGGVTVNDKMQVLDKNGNIIPNVYAAGEIANTPHGNDSAPGANVGYAVTTGKTVSDEIIKALK